MTSSPAIEQLRLLNYQDGEKVYYRAIADNKPRKLSAIFPAIPPELKTLNEDGFNIYVVVNGGGDKDADVTACKAIFYEHDDIPKENQLLLWQSIELPEPTFQVDTGGKSIHSYWVFDRAIAVDLWRSLHTDLLNYSNADRSIKNPSRVMRLGGFKHQKTGELASIVSKSEIKYSYDELRGLIPTTTTTTTTVVKGKKSKTVMLPPASNHTSASPRASSSTQAIPLVNCLAKSNRDLLCGVTEPGRNVAGAALARDLIGVANCFKANGIDYDGEPRSLFDEFCQKCKPPIGEGTDDHPDEPDNIWKSAVGDNPQPSLNYYGDDGLDNIIETWNLKNDPSEEMKRCPYFTSSPAKGLYRVGLKKDEETGEFVKKREWIGKHLECVAYVNNPEGNGSSLQLEFATIRGHLSRWTMPRGYIVSDTPMMLAELVNRGYQFNIEKKKLLIQYLNRPVAK